MDDHRLQPKDASLQGVLEDIATDASYQKEQDTKKTIIPAYASKVSDVLYAIYPTKLCDESTSESKIAFCCWWRGLARGTLLLSACRNTPVVYRLYRGKPFGFEACTV